MDEGREEEDEQEEKVTLSGTRNGLFRALLRERIIQMLRPAGYWMSSDAIVKSLASERGIQSPDGDLDFWGEVIIVVQGMKREGIVETQQRDPDKVFDWNVRLEVGTP